MEIRVEGDDGKDEGDATEEEQQDFYEEELLATINAMEEDGLNFVQALTGAIDRSGKYPGLAGAIQTATMKVAMIAVIDAMKEPSASLLFTGVPDGKPQQPGGTNSDRVPRRVTEVERLAASGPLDFLLDDDAVVQERCSRQASKSAVAIPRAK